VAGLLKEHGNRVYDINVGGVVCDRVGGVIACTYAESLWVVANVCDVGVWKFLDFSTPLTAS
jgi:hypothetical protein